MDTTRREFLQAVVVVGGAGLVGCGGAGGTDAGPTGSDAGPPETDAGPAESDAGSAGCATPSATVGTNHGHVLMVSAAEVTAGADRTYDIQGTSGHTHSVTLTAADFASLAGGGTVMVTSSTGAAHSHAIMVVCG